MIGILIAVSAAIFGIAVMLVAVVAWSIHREDKAYTLGGRPAHPAYGLARHLMDVHVTGVISDADGRHERFTLQGNVHLAEHDQDNAARPPYGPRSQD
ncbi:MAG: hypothetical protein GEV11_03135 [Streptosporangiales bacterium]|nr:hypothetical protein [Streptosporangiales bacterium]